MQLIGICGLCSGGDAAQSECFSVVDWPLVEETDGVSRAYHRHTAYYKSCLIYCMWISFNVLP